MTAMTSLSLVHTVMENRWLTNYALFLPLEMGNPVSVSVNFGGGFQTIKIMKPAKIYWGPKDISKDACPLCPLL